MRRSTCAGCPKRQGTSIDCSASRSGSGRRSERKLISSGTNSSRFPSVRPSRMRVNCMTWRAMSGSGWRAVHRPGAAPIACCGAVNGAIPCFTSVPAIATSPHRRNGTRMWDSVWPAHWNETWVNRRLSQTVHQCELPERRAVAPKVTTFRSGTSSSRTARRAPRPSADARRAVRCDREPTTHLHRCLQRGK